MLSGIWSCQRPVEAVRVPRRMVVESNLMVTAVAVKVATQPWSQRVPMEMREPEASVGNI